MKFFSINSSCSSYGFDRSGTLSFEDRYGYGFTNFEKDSNSNSSCEI